MADYLFFVSYARHDRIDPQDQDYIVKFYKDLNREVRYLIGSDHDRIGFLDTHRVETGEHWTDELEEALRTCKVFVPMYSPTYFKRDYCGKEWQFFSLRIKEYCQAQVGAIRYLPLFLPVLYQPHWPQLRWLPPNLPNSITEIQYYHEDFPEVYKQEGLRYMMRLHGERDNYERFVTKFAQRLVMLAEQYDLTPSNSLHSIKDVESAFHQHQDDYDVPENTTYDRDLRHVQGICIVSCRKELGDVKENVEYYGQNGKDWRPYLPKNEDEIALIVQEAVTKERFMCEVISLSDTDIVRAIKSAQERKRIVVIIIDVWTLFIERNKEFIYKFIDEIDKVRNIILIPWNPDDEETDKEMQKLEASLREMVLERITGESQLLCYPIYTSEDLQDELSKSLQKVRQDIINHAKMRKVEGNQRVEMPTIEGPGGK